MSQNAAGSLISFIISFFLSFFFLVYHVKSRFFLDITNPDITPSLIQFSSVTQLCPTLCNPIDCSMPGPLVHHQLLECVQTHVHWVGDAIQPPHPLLSPCPPAFNLSQDQGLFQWVSSLHQVAKEYKPSPITRDKSHAWSKPIPEPIPDFVCSSLLSVWASHLVLVVKNPPANAGDTEDAGDMGLIPGSERSTRVGKSTPLQHSCLENYVGRGAWQTTVHGPAKSRTQLSTAQHSSTAYCLPTSSAFSTEIV